MSKLCLAWHAFLAIFTNCPCMRVAICICVCVNGSRSVARIPFLIRYTVNSHSRADGPPHPPNKRYQFFVVHRGAQHTHTQQQTKHCKWIKSFSSIYNFHAACCERTRFWPAIPFTHCLYELICQLNGNDSNDVLNEMPGIFIFYTICLRFTLLRVLYLFYMSSVW